MRRLSRENGQPVLSADAIDALTRYSFPGNVRSSNILERALALSGNRRHGRRSVREFGSASRRRPARAAGRTTRGHRRDAILKALEQTRYNKTAAAKLLGMSFRALRYRIKKLGLE
jgi:two-component system response regulator PilR (NtrC family)